MLCLGKPSESMINKFLLDQKEKSLSYELVKGTCDHLSFEAFQKDLKYKNYNLDHHRTLLGKGEEVFQKAIQGLRSWKQFNMGWVETYYPDTPLVAGSDIAILARSLGVWTISACRVVYVIEEAAMDSPPFRRFGFAYGTLDQHVERGEERFLIEWNTETDEVFYEILSFSVQNLWFAKAGYPVARYFQQCFATDSLKALQRWIDGQPLDDVVSEVTIV